MSRRRDRFESKLDEIARVRRREYVRRGPSVVRTRDRGMEFLCPGVEGESDHVPHWTRPQRQYVTRVEPLHDGVGELRFSDNGEGRPWYACHGARDGDEIVSTRARATTSEAALVDDDPPIPDEAPR